MPIAFISPPDVDIKPILQQLDQNGIDYRLVEREGHQELWVTDDALAVRLQEAFQQYIAGQKQRLSLQNLKGVPVTAVSMLICILVAIWTQLGESNVEPFLIADMVFYPRGWTWTLDAEHILRLFTPVFLHFGVTHLVFNMLALWYLGNTVERKIGHFTVLVVFLLIAVASNVAQLVLDGPMFGGFSGIIYGLIGFAWWLQVQGHPLHIPKGLFIFAGVWLLAGITPVFSVIGIHMANAAHISGVISGLVCATVWTLLHPAKNK